MLRLRGSTYFYALLDIASATEMILKHADILSYERNMLDLTYVEVD